MEMASADIGEKSTGARIRLMRAGESCGAIQTEQGAFIDDNAPESHAEVASASRDPGE